MSCLRAAEHHPDAICMYDVHLHCRQESSADQPAAGAPAASLSQAELKKFAKLSAEWWNPHGAFRPLHAMNPVRCSFIRSALCQCFE